MEVLPHVPHVRRCMLCGAKVVVVVMKVVDAGERAAAVAAVQSTATTAQPTGFYFYTTHNMRTNTPSFRWSRSTLCWPCCFVSVSTSLPLINSMLGSAYLQKNIKTHTNTQPIRLGFHWEIHSNVSARAYTKTAATTAKRLWPNCILVAFLWRTATARVLLFIVGLVQGKSALQIGMCVNDVWCLQADSFSRGTQFLGF